MLIQRCIDGLYYCLCGSPIDSQVPRAESVVVTVSIYTHMWQIYLFHLIQIHDIKLHCTVDMSRSQIPWQTNLSSLHCGSKVNSQSWFMASSVTDLGKCTRSLMLWMCHLKVENHLVEMACSFLKDSS